MSRRRLLVAGAAAVSTAAALLFGRAAARRNASPRPVREGGAQTRQLAAGFAAGDTRRSCCSCRRACAHARRTSAASTCSGSPTSSARARRATPRTTSSPTACCARALRLAPNDLDATSGLASLALSRHRFALALAARPPGARDLTDDRAQLRRRRRRAARARPLHRRRSPRSTRWRGSSRASRRTRASPTRASCSADSTRARSALLLARDAAADEPEPLAWTETQLGKLELVARPAGRRDDAPARGAAHVPRLRLRTRRARTGRGRARQPRARDDARAPRGRDDPAAAVRRALRRPAAGDRPRARRAHCSTRPRTASGACSPRTACAPISRPRSSTSTTASACTPRSRSRASAQRERPSIDGDDVLAWALARNGRCGEALHYSKLALRLGTKDSREALPPRRDRALPRPRPAPVGTARGRAQPPLLDPLDLDPQEARIVKRLVLLAAACYLLRPGRRRLGAPARQLHHQPLRARRGRRRPAVRPLRRRHGRDPDAAARPDPHRRAARLRRRTAGRAARRRRPHSPIPRARRGSARRASRRSSPGRASRGPRPSRSTTATTRGRIGWKEIVFGATTRSTSDELRAYPKDLLRSPLDVTQRAGSSHRTSDAPPALLSGRALAAPDRIADSGFASLVGRRHLSALVVLARSRSPSSGAPRTRCRPGTARRSSPRTSSARAARRGTPRCSG